MTVHIVNKYKVPKDTDYIYGGKGSPLGNKWAFAGMSKEQRDNVCDKFEEWAKTQLNQNTPFRTEILRLIELHEKQDITLACFCNYPEQRCHLDFVKRVIEKNSRKTVKKIIESNSRKTSNLIKGNTMNNFVMTNNTEMNTFSPKQWLLIDAASKFGMDKKHYDVRLAWGRELLESIRIGSDCQHYIDEADEPALFAKAILAIKDTLEGEATGHVIGLDAAASGPQLLSILTHCETGMKNTGAINTGNVPDLYTTIFKNMQVPSVELTRDQVKKATVPYVYGSDFAPQKVFGDLAPEFEEAYERTVPLAAMVRRILIDAWDESATSYEFPMPDGAIVYLETRANDDFKGNKMGGFQYTFRCSVNRPLKKDEKGAKSLPANVTHSCDAFVVREIGARCHYNTRLIQNAIHAIEAHLEPEFEGVIDSGEYADLELRMMESLWKRFNFLSVAPLEMIKKGGLHGLSSEYLLALKAKAEWMLEYNSFQIFTIHDEFKCAPNHIERMRTVYNSIIAELYKSTWLLSTIETLTGNRYTWTKPTDEEIYNKLLNSNYAIG